jgi:hypothetical protein
MTVPTVHRPPNAEVAAFLERLAAVPAVRVGTARRPRLLLAFDATASREATWGRAQDLTAAILAEGLRAGGGLDVSLCYFRGPTEMAATPFLSSGEELGRRLQGIRCRGGHTQIARVLAHALDRHAEAPLSALVLVGDACEEPLDLISAGAGALGLRGLRTFALQEGDDPEAARAFAALARLTGGAHVPFDAASPEVLRRLLEGIAAWSAGGVSRLARLAQASPEAARLLRRLPPPGRSL